MQQRPKDPVCLSWTEEHPNTHIYDFFSHVCRFASKISMSWEMVLADRLEDHLFVAN
jgi:hypothetical protein